MSGAILRSGINGIAFRDLPRLKDCFPSAFARARQSAGFLADDEHALNTPGRCDHFKKILAHRLRQRRALGGGKVRRQAFLRLAKFLHGNQDRLHDAPVALLANNSSTSRASCSLSSIVVMTVLRITAFIPKSSIACVSPASTGSITNVAQMS